MSVFLENLQDDTESSPVPKDRGFYLAASGPNTFVAWLLWRNHCLMGNICIV